MCGLAGIWTLDTHPREREGSLHLVSAMTEVLSHRGPDDTGVWCDSAAGVALGHRRLSIIDLSHAGHQPMTGPSGATVIVFNGEIYNYLELRETIAGRIPLRSATDTEVILALYERHGADCVRFLRGMFAFAIWDMRQRRLLIARDRIGKKPLYYTARNGRLVFASEMKALREALEPGELSVNARSLNRFLSFGFVSGPETIYRDVYQLPPASILIATAPDRHQVHQYWSPFDPAPRSRAVDAEELESILVDSIRIRLRSDVPVATFLSGGIDSGLVTAVAASFGGRISTFTVGFDDPGFDERPLAREVARRFSTDHHEVSIRPDVERMLPAVVSAYDQPFADPSAIPSYCVAEAVAEHGFKVVLNGDGGDELFGGYRRALAAAWLSTLHRVAGGPAVRTVARAALGLLGTPRSHRGDYAFLHRFVRGAAADELTRLLIWSTDSFTTEERRDLGMQAYDEAGDPGGLASYLHNGSDMSPATSLRALDLAWALPYCLLVKMDIATMAHSLEARSPLLDQELVEAQMTRSGDALWPGFRTKPVLRQIARKYLPHDVVIAPKRGFEPPLHRWVTQDLRALRDDLLLAPDGLVADVGDRAGVEKFLRSPSRADPYRWAQQVWILLSLAAWDRFVNHGTPSWSISAFQTS